MQPAKLVAVGIAQICEIELAERILAIARRILDWHAAGLDPRLVPSIDLFRAVEREADCPAVGVTCRMPVDWRSDHEHRALAAVAQPALVVGPGRLAEQAVVEAPRSLDVVRSDHDVTEHRSLLLSRRPRCGCF